MGLVWSVHVPSKDNDSARVNKGEGESYHSGGGSKTVFGEQPAQ